MTKKKTTKKKPTTKASEQAGKVDDIAIEATFKPRQVSDQDVFETVSAVVWLGKKAGEDDPTAVNAALVTIRRILVMQDAAKGGWVAVAG